MKKLAYLSLIFFIGVTSLNAYGQGYLRFGEAPVKLAGKVTLPGLGDGWLKVDNATETITSAISGPSSRNRQHIEKRLTFTISRETSHSGLFNFKEAALKGIAFTHVDFIEGRHAKKNSSTVRLNNARIEGVKTSYKGNGKHDIEVTLLFAEAIWRGATHDDYNREVRPPILQSDAL